MKKALLLFLILLLSVSCRKNIPVPNEQDDFNLPKQGQNTPAVFAEPVPNAKARITKKPFGIYVTPQNSPVKPEKFAGYHTGVDFETTPDEQNADVPVGAICEGKILEKRFATGYGGVLVQSCELEGSPITVVYGHLRLSSIKANNGETLQKGKQFAVLGIGFSSETDGERKHLHLGIHKGSSANIKGYVQTQTELGSWINFADYLQ